MIAARRKGLLGTASSGQASQGVPHATSSSWRRAVPRRLQQKSLECFDMCVREDVGGVAMGTVVGRELITPRMTPHLGDERLR
jgi:hypothetical protein